VIAGFFLPASGNHFAVVRYNVDGTVDTSFGVGGKAQTAFGNGDDTPRRSWCREMGKSVVAGAPTPESHVDFALVRYNADGSLDGGFGNGGK